MTIRDEIAPQAVSAPATATRSLRVIEDRVLILPEPEPKQLIWTPSDPHKRYRTGKVVAMGDGMKVAGRGSVRYGTRVIPWKGPLDAHGYNRWPMPQVKIGDRVLYLVWAKNDVLINKIEHHLVRDNALELIFSE